MQHVDAKDGCERSADGSLGGPIPAGVAKIDALRGAQIGQVFMFAPGSNALEMRRVYVTRPPGQVRCAMGERNGVLSGSASQFQHITGLLSEELHDH